MSPRTGFDAVSAESTINDIRYGDSDRCQPNLEEALRAFFEALAPVEMVTRALEAGECGAEAVALRVALRALESAYEQLNVAMATVMRRPGRFG
jgi:hypothetical protein